MRRTLRERLLRWTYPYTPLATVTFLLGALAGGVAVAVTPTESLAAAAESFGNTNPFPDRLTTWTIFQNNVIVLGVLAVGAVTFGAATAFALLLNGFLLGALVVATGDPWVTLLLIVPHGVFELGAFFLVGGVAYRTTWRLVSYLRGVDDAPITRQELGEAAAIIAVGVVVLALAAWVEANLTLRIARAITGEPLGLLVGRP